MHVYQRVQVLTGNGSRSISPESLCGLYLPIDVCTYVHRMYLLYNNLDTVTEKAGPENNDNVGSFKPSEKKKKMS